MQHIRQQAHLKASAPAYGRAKAPLVQWHARITQRRHLSVSCTADSASPGPSDSAQPGAQSRSNPFLPALRPQVYLQFCQVANKQVITRTKGRNLGNVRNFWVDPRSGRVVSLDLDEKKSLTSTRVANIPLSSLRQIGDVVLVNDEEATGQMPYDDRYGFVALIGMGVRTRSGTVLGKVRDVMFSPDTGAISRIAYDEFGLSFLPTNFFDLWSFPTSYIASMAPAEVVVYDDVVQQVRKDSEGVFASIPKLLGALGNAGDGLSTVPVSRQLGPGTTDAYTGAGGAAALPPGYTRDRWLADIQAWERETGWTYEQYLRWQDAQRQGQQGSTMGLPPPGGVQRGQQYPAAQQQGGYGYGLQQPQQPQQGAWGGGAAGAGAYDFRGAGAAPAQGRYAPPQQRDPRTRTSQQPQQQQPQRQPQPPQQQFGQQPSAGGYEAWPQQRQQQQQAPAPYGQPQQQYMQQNPGLPQQQPQPARQQQVPQQPVRQQPSAAAPPSQQQAQQAPTAAAGQRVDDWIVRSQAAPEPLLAAEQYPPAGAAAENGSGAPAAKI